MINPKESKLVVPRLRGINTVTGITLMFALTSLATMVRLSDIEAYNILGDANHYFEFAASLIFAYLCLHPFRTSDERRLLLRIGFTANLLVCIYSVAATSELYWVSTITTVLYGAITTNTRGFERLVLLGHLRLYFPKEFEGTRQLVINLFRSNYAIIAMTADHLEGIEACLLSAGAYRVMNGKQYRDFTHPNTEVFPLTITVLKSGEYRVGNKP